jgi:hypothetical protein
MEYDDEEVYEYYYPEDDQMVEQPGYAQGQQ